MALAGSPKDGTKQILMSGQSEQGEKGERYGSLSYTCNAFYAHTCSGQAPARYAYQCLNSLFRSSGRKFWRHFKCLLSSYPFLFLSLFLFSFLSLLSVIHPWKEACWSSNIRESTEATFARPQRHEGKDILVRNHELVKERLKYGTQTSNVLCHERKCISLAWDDPN